MFLLDDVEEEPVPLGTMEGFEYWIKTKLNSLASACESYVRSYDESPPERLTQPYYAMRDTWDGLQIIVHNDDRYKVKEAHSYKEKGFLLYLKEYVSVKHPQEISRIINKLPPQEKKKYKSS